jgi:hypothetical protein
MAASLPPGDRALLRHIANLNDDIDQCLFQRHQLIYSYRNLRFSCGSITVA